MIKSKRDLGSRIEVPPITQPVVLAHEHLIAGPGKLRRNELLLIVLLERRLQLRLDVGVVVVGQLLDIYYRQSCQHLQPSPLLSLCVSIHVIDDRNSSR